MHERLVGAVHQQLRLLLDALGRSEADVGPHDRFADRGGIGGVVFATLAGEAIRHDELGRHQPHGVAVAGERLDAIVNAEKPFNVRGCRLRIAAA